MSTGFFPDNVIKNLEDLFKCALLNKKFYEIYRKNELSLIQGTLFCMNPPAWELREMTPPWKNVLDMIKDPERPRPKYTPSSYLQCYGRDVLVLAQLKIQVLRRCHSILRPETISGLENPNDDIRATEVDRAFWRIWTFCRIFGCGKDRHAEIGRQISWLKGGAEESEQHMALFNIEEPLFDPGTAFGKGNGDGLSLSDLLDMNEIWVCLQKMLREALDPLSNKDMLKKILSPNLLNEISLAETGTRKTHNTSLYNFVEEWLYYIMTLGPYVLTCLVSTRSPNEALRTVEYLGLTKWDPPAQDDTRQVFFGQAMTRFFEYYLSKG
ncbi:conserved hypothetical protein [Talaromyces stipitatus ATCC 10500]|uniref:Uncharacterized protein n=1 Tax=Talaromyces stipitatus (strain ATCC 10500 / CBS 375.48 / QM 6759 / NRRL 1006) TaxID=441959 RepID=B8MUT7_TALSN|nr:uncharacterized protein TSTA_110370 [Talaromyces stipitatus ATCC 10500]EED11857.1 conserved hypothetical protein [Talaromyces stipitatus ATCC 10500]